MKEINIVVYCFLSLYFFFFLLLSFPIKYSFPSVNMQAYDKKKGCPAYFQGLSSKIANSYKIGQEREEKAEKRVF